MTITKNAIVTTDLETNIYFGVLNRPLYVCEALPGNTDPAQKYWRIRRYFYSGITRRNTFIRWASGSNEFHFVANDRASYTYLNTS